MTAPEGSVKDVAQDRLKAGESSDNDAKRQMQRAAGADERTRELEVGARVDEKPRVLLAEPEESELVEAPADHALILGRQPLRGVWKLGCGHLSF